MGRTLFRGLGILPKMTAMPQGHKRWCRPLQCSQGLGPEVNPFLEVQGTHSPTMNILMTEVSAA